MQIIIKSIGCINIRANYGKYIVNKNNVKTEDIKTFKGRPMAYNKNNMPRWNMSLLRYYKQYYLRLIVTFDARCENVTMSTGTEPLSEEHNSGSPPRTDEYPAPITSGGRGEE